MPEKKNSQTGNFLSWLFKKHFLKLEIIFTPTINKKTQTYADTANPNNKKRGLLSRAKGILSK